MSSSAKSGNLCIVIIAFIIYKETVMNNDKVIKSNALKIHNKVLHELLHHTYELCRFSSNTEWKEMVYNLVEYTVEAKGEGDQVSKLNPILDGGGKFAPPAGFFNIAQKPLGLGS